MVEKVFCGNFSIMARSKVAALAVFLLATLPAIVKITLPLGASSAAAGSTVASNKAETQILAQFDENMAVL
jgi:hypothetical protein